MIPQIKKILYTTDLSKNSAYAFRYAVDMAQRHEAKIVILHVIEPIPPHIKHYVSMYVDEAEWEGKIKKEQQLTIERIRKRLQEFCKREVQGNPLCVEQVSTILVHPGHPVDEILKVVDGEKCDLIILGTHGKGFLLETFLGSVAHSVLDRSRKPVFIVPLPHGKTDITFEEI
jgi:nucleotide-binding universal stress UspA family protein